mgnify:CR=1 FL=1
MSTDQAPRRFRIVIDVGGTFTDLGLDDGAGRVRAFKASTTPADPAQGVLSVLMKAAFERRLSLTELLEGTDQIVLAADALHGTDLAGLEERLARAGFAGRLVRPDAPRAPDPP